MFRIYYYARLVYHAVFFRYWFKLITATIVCFKCLENEFSLRIACRKLKCQSVQLENVYGFFFRLFDVMQKKP